ncbi:hypothetical protein CMQ_1547 [Grosmannia clavigera kw1407]|uniref:Uncharacterized protein n=1 Tax=Grosmannia clavigera (strain kw1407 / UAMH 11150) TaxID=655863 RepID=F0XET8_GROCL|nr:uncharacterized protein CMQ_1547 [Grosmannia clavigera kw1407]EFX04619.1 hypothetical protein CMQ_1547 [Grosmannia clavigera kw1407]
MDNFQPTYHLPPNFSTPPPPKGPFHLGTVIRDFDRREQMRPLNHGKDIYGKSKILPIEADMVYSDRKTRLFASQSQMQSGKLGPWTKFIAIDGVGREGDSYEFDYVDTKFFYPSRLYISQCMAISDVDEYVRVTNYKKAVFLVTGLKVARASTRQKGDLPGTKPQPGGMPPPEEAHVRASLSPEEMGHPSGSHGAGMLRVSTVSEKFSQRHIQEEWDIVVGIQCLKIYYKGMFTGNMQLEDETYTDGATFLGEDDVEQKIVQYDDLRIVGPADYNNPSFSPETVVSDDGTEIEVWMLPTSKTEK